MSIIVVVFVLLFFQLYYYFCMIFDGYLMILNYLE